ncbi:dTDP-6-deoxy-L-talose 4-dehydrogenase (NAD(P)(+)) [Planctomycetes bacterium MalM25]|nr:dTDP-6-deoxy-L-talose 4-dehydrogenase (NAD(P)(+)) [Planctomycetes bacterium MalM25]
MPHTLVTGATGFIGNRLVERLVERGDEVACLVRPSSRTERLDAFGVGRVVGALDDAEALAESLRAAGPFDTVYHLAGLTHATRLEDFLAVNADGVEHLGRALAAIAPSPTLVLVSSLAAAGPSPPGEPHTESTPPAPISNYGRSKLAGEEAARRYADQLSLSILRPPAVFGPGDRDGLMLFQSLRRFPLHLVPQMKGLPLSLIYVDDLVEALITVGDRGERVVPGAANDDPRGVYYVADPEASSYAQMGRYVGAALGKKVFVLCRRKYPFLPLAWGGDLWGKIRGKAPLFGMDKLREASASGWVCDPGKIREGLGWSPAKPLAERYQETGDWYREAGWL